VTARSAAAILTKLARGEKLAKRANDFQKMLADHELIKAQFDETRERFEKLKERLAMIEDVISRERTNPPISGAVH
jgi:polyhydroxyalkanoate synthesis regulator phasin